MGTTDHRVALVTGGASGIGRATVDRLVSDGVTVVIADIADEAGEGAAAELRGRGASASYLHLDVSDEASWEQAVTAIGRDHGRLDILVNNAGIGDLDPIETTSFETYRRVVAITQTSVFLGMPLPEVLVGLAAERFDAAGSLTDEDTREEVRDLLVSLAAWTRRLCQSGGEAAAS